MNETPFQTELKKQIRKYIRTLRAEGTVAMSVENLMQCVRSPLTDLGGGAPLGVNRQYAYAQLFREVCESSKDIKSFLL